MPNATQLIVPITTSPVAAVLAAAGVAQWLGNLGRQVTGDIIDVRMAHVGSAIAVTTPTVLSPEQMRLEHYQNPLFKWIRTAKNGAAPQGIAIIDYEAERQHNAEYYETRKRYQQSGVNLRKLSQEQQNELEAKAPRSYWPVVAMVNQMSALTTYNKAAQRWFDCKPAYPQLAALIWKLFGGQPDATEQAERMWVQLATQYGLEKDPLLPATQIVNPEQGKGANRTKADALTIGGQDSFWLLEYFKFAGLHTAALPRTVQEKKDRKTYVVLPAHNGIEQRWYEETFNKFQKEFWASSAIKMDIQASLRYTATMLETWQGATSSTGRRRQPSDFVEGFAVISYKDLGSAFAVMNVATIGLPNWITWPNDVAGTQQNAMASAQQIINLITAHQLLIGVLDEKKGEEEQLLRDYRDFLSSRDPALTAFFRFTTGYAGHILRKMSRRQPVRRLTIQDLEVIVMAQEEQRMMKLKPLTENQGFLRIATAIRQSTVTQQYHRSESGDTTYDIRYGLANDLHRHSRNNNEFMRALGEFISDYSQENARVMERMAKQQRKQYRKRVPISTDDLTQLSELIDSYGAPTVASMLVAFGYARDAGIREDEPTPVTNDSETTLADEIATEQQDEESPF